MDGYSYLNEKEQVFTKERRVNKRCKYKNKFKVESINSKPVNLEFDAIDISISGIGFISEVKFEINDILEITFSYNKVTIPVMIIIEHVNLYDSGYFVGGRFAALQDSYREIMKDIMS